MQERTFSFFFPKRSPTPLFPALKTAGKITLHGKVISTDFSMVKVGCFRISLFKMGSLRAGRFGAGVTMRFSSDIVDETSARTQLCVNNLDSRKVPHPTRPGGILSLVMGAVARFLSLSLSLYRSSLLFSYELPFSREHWIVYLTLLDLLSQIFI
jgi:hypothetical protein